MGILISLLPTLLRFVNLILDKSGADAEERKKVTELIMNSSGEAKTPIEMKDDFADLTTRLKAKMKAKAQA